MLRETLHIVSPIGRLQAIPSLASSVAYRAIPELDIYWHVSIQQREDRWGAEQFRDIFKSISYGWVWPLCDDNVIHPEFMKELYQAIVTDERLVKVFSEKRKDRVGNLRACPENVKPCLIDGAQAIVHSSIMREYTFECGEGRSRNDGLLLEQIYHDYPEEFQFIDKPVVYFNALSWMSEDVR